MIDKAIVHSDTLKINNIYMSGGTRFRLTEKQCAESCRSDPKHNCIAALSVNGYVCWKYFGSPSSTITEVWLAFIVYAPYNSFSSFFVRLTSIILIYFEKNSVIEKINFRCIVSIQ